MQVSATLIAAQAAAREARARLAMPQAAQQPGFAAALEKAEGFSPLPLKQAARASGCRQLPRTAPRQQCPCGWGSIWHRCAGLW